MIELKPCPCCGAQAELVTRGPEGDEYEAWIACVECGLCTVNHGKAIQAAAVWNRRTNTDRKAAIKGAIAHYNDIGPVEQKRFDQTFDEWWKSKEEEE